MKAAQGRATVIGADGRAKASMTDTVITEFGNWPADAHVPGWDQQNGGSVTNRMQRLRTRADRGQTMTPTGRGVTIKRR